ncbi:MAG TPA: M1 family metallopeptidase [Candidatus Krumholzibacteria bacterium]|nr:M1 family metallopeptidase [Candidatus Krumholzibacteria bacterium]
MRRAVAILATILAVAALPAAAADYFQQFVHYTIQVKLDTERHWITGSESIVYFNQSPDTLREFYLHLYPNAFRSKDVPYQRDKQRAYNLTLRDIPGDHRGWIDLNNVRIGTDSVTVDVDGTIAHMQLPRPLAPGDSMTIAFNFDGKVRKGADRSGYGGDHYDFAQWYPKVVVYDEKGFHPDQFMTGEFYGEFGTFDVDIELPDHYVVVATGVVRDGDPGWDYNPAHQPDAPRRKPTGATRTVSFHAENVHDFAWCADPAYVVQDTTLHGVAIRSAYRRRSASTWEDSTLAHAVRAIQWLEEKVGPYPYPQITVAEMLRTGGMEYPMLVMDGRADEGLVIHEIGHVYFYGILGNNEREEAWMDEGITSFQTRWYQELHYGPWGDTSKWNFYQRMTPQYKLWENYRRNVFDLERRHYGERVSYRAEDYIHNYRANVYDKAALTMNTIRWVAGDELFEKILHEYFERWKFKHVNEDRFRAVCEEVAQRDLSRQFEQWLHTTKTVDYKLESVRTRPDSAGVTTEVNVKRIGELYCPIEVAFKLPDGNVVRQRMDARDRTLRARVSLPAEPVQVAINPDNEIMDRDMSNNFLPRKRDFQIDWPNNHYYPEDAYQIRHRPAIWYNDVDGAKVGYHLSGSLHNWTRRVQLGLYYGVESDRLDFSASFAQPKRWFGANSTFRVDGFKMEGREHFGVGFDFLKRAKLLEPPTYEFNIGYAYHELRNPRYLTSTETYDTLQADVGPYIGYAVSPELDIASTRLEADLRLGRDWFGGNYDYERLALTATVHSRPSVVGVDTRLRFFGGFSGGGTPTQRKFNLAGAGPVQQDERFWLRSPGAVPEDLNYVEPGDGNLRGYYPGTFGVNKLTAFNAEAGTRVRLFGLEKKTAKLLGNLSWYAFYDAGWIMDKGNPISSSARVQGLVDGGVLDATLQDAGIGLRSHVAWPFWNFTWRFDVPLWVSNPEVNVEADKVDFRYIFSLNATF